MTSAAAAARSEDPSPGGRLVAADGRTLPLAGVAIAASARGGLARAVLTQRFRNPHAEPLRVTYLFPMPHDAAVSGFAFVLGGRRTVGEVDRKAAARERFEAALVEGRTAALAEELRGSLFSQEVGNLPPGAEVEVELTVDQRLAWLPEGAWEWRFPTAVAPRYPGAGSRTPDARRIEVDVADRPIPARLSLALHIEEPLAAGGAVSSPSHAVHAAGDGDRRRVALAAEQGAALDRDVVVRWPVAAPEVGLGLDVARPGQGSRLGGRAFGLLTLVPPTAGAVDPLPRDLVVLLDTSGSMSGAPLDQARAVVSALVSSLGPQDRLELVEFSDRPRRWRPDPVQATPRARKEALAWLAGLQAGGSTEMGDALVEALRPLAADAQRQVVLVTDGEIGFEKEVLATLLERLPPGSRLHTVGVGSAVNRSLTAPTARAGRGVEVLIGLGEPPEVAARRLVARTAAPSLVDVEVEGSALVARAPARLPDLLGGAPLLIGLELAPQGGNLTVRGRTAGGRFERTVTVPAAAPGDGSRALAPLFAREAAEDLELRAAAGERVDDALERLGLDFQVSTRLTSWVAVSEEPSVDPSRPTRRVRVPQQLPHGMSVEGLGLRAARPARMASPAMGFLVPQMVSDPMDRMPDFDESTQVARRRTTRHLKGKVVLLRGKRLVVEVAVGTPGLDWSPGRSVWVLRQGGLSRAMVVAEGTTAAGFVEGQVVRLVLDLGGSAGAGRPTQIRLGYGTEIAIPPDADGDDP